MLPRASKSLAFASLLMLLAAGCSSAQRQSFSSRRDTTVQPTAGELNRDAEDQRNDAHLSNWRPGVNVPANYR